MGVAAACSAPAPAAAEQSAPADGFDLRIGEDRDYSPHTAATFALTERVLHLTTPHRTSIEAIAGHLETAGYPLTGLPL